MWRMTDLTTIVVAGIGAVTTLLNGGGGYWLSGRNDEARDNRALEREQKARREDRVDRLQEQRREWQRQTLLDLQDELQKLARATGKILIQDRTTVREKGGVFLLPEGLGGDESLAATVAVRKLAARVLDDGLRARVGDFVKFCGYANTGAVIEHKGDPPDVIEAVIYGLEVEMATR
jgi:hypothetical protein